MKIISILIELALEKFTTIPFSHFTQMDGNLKPSPIRYSMFHWFPLNEKSYAPIQHETRSFEDFMIASCPKMNIFGFHNHKFTNLLCFVKHNTHFCMVKIM